MKTLLKLRNFAFIALPAFLFFSSFRYVALQPKIEFTETEFNFGTMNENSDVSHVFQFTNKGTAPLLISDVVKSCGCTTPEWTDKPVAPGEKGSITLRFDSKRVGPFNKSVTVKSNDPENPTLILKISGTIISKSDNIPLKPENKGIPKE